MWDRSRGDSVAVVRSRFYRSGSLCVLQITALNDVSYIRVALSSLIVQTTLVLIIIIIKTMMSSKVKVLLAGRIDTVEQAATLVRKLAALHANKKAGPFDVALACCATTAALGELLQHQSSSPSRLPPLYLQDTTATALWVNQHHQQTKDEDEDDVPNKKPTTSNKDCEEDEKDSKNSPSPPCFQMAPNLYVLRDKTNKSSDPQAGIWNLPFGTALSNKHQSLVVASLPPQFRVDRNDNNNNTSPLEQSITHVSYTGCDFLLSTEWPQGIETILPASTSSQNDNNFTQLLSFDVADVALKARARYHVAFLGNNNAAFQQSPAFRHCQAATSTVAPQHSGRFLALCPVQLQQQPGDVVDKSRKFVHAVGVVPLHSQAVQQTLADASSWLSCPYTDAVYPVDPRLAAGAAATATNPSAATTTTTAGGLSEAAARRILNEDRNRPTMSGTNRWAQRKKRTHDEHIEQEVDPSNCTLFIHGLNMDVTGRLQNESQGGDQLLLQALRPFPGALRVRRPAASGHSTAFVFVEFESHEQAAACLQQTGGSLSVEGVSLTLKWATTSSSKKDKDHAKRPKQQQHRRLMEADARDSSTLYFKFTPSSSSIDEELLPSISQAGEVLRLAMERTLERALAGEDCREEDIVKAADEPALQVQARFPTAADGDDDNKQKKNRNFGFLDFASHAAASMALATLTGSTDGGRVLEEQQEATMNNDPVHSPQPSKEASDSGQGKGTVPARLDPHHVGIYLHWAQARAESAVQRRERDMIEADDGSGFRFERKHFPADARQDCWFCLASEACEKHLITGVYHSCYSAMPKGPVHPGHILLVPVQHSSQGALKDATVAKEMDQLKVQLRKHAATAYDCDLFVFERAIQTKGGYHTHVQCIPVDRKLGLKLQATMLAQARKLGMELREINSDVALQAVLSSDDEDADVGGYFYAEVPVSGSSEYKRFLFKAGASTKTSVPLQFGREVLAAVLGRPELAHWKSCVVDKEQEASIAADFRSSFGQVQTS